MKPPIVTAMEGWLGDFQADLAYYLTCGYVWSSPEAFVCARPIRHTKGVMDNVTVDDADCWLVWWAAGDMMEMFRIVPKELKYIAFYRRGKELLKVYEFRKLRRKINGRHSKAGG